MKLLVEGWLGLNHSYSLVNQYQLLELRKSNIHLFHSHLPNDRGWNDEKNNHGLPPSDFESLKSIPAPSPCDFFDAIYRISFPLRTYPGKASNIFVFGTSEYQTLNGSVFLNGDCSEAVSNESLKIITPSKWSSLGFLKAGFPESRLKVIPHGVNLDIFNIEKKIFKNDTRASLDLTHEQFVLLSIGAMTTNKGIDLLIVAFLILRKKYSHLRLVLKDSSNLYPITGASVIQAIRNSTFNRFLNEDYLKDIVLISDNLSLDNLGKLYGAVDCYVSPYRAEGFNLPPLEASACGTPILITKGGATDEYFNRYLGEQIEGSLNESNELTWIEPDLESILFNLTKYIEGNMQSYDLLKSAEYIKENFTWEKVTKELVASIKSL